MKSFIFNYFIEPIFRDIIRKICVYHEAKGEHQGRLAYTEASENIYRMEHHNKLVISVSQSDINPVVGYVSDWTDRVPHIKDILSGEELVCFGKLFVYDERIIHILDYLNPEDRYTIVTGITSGKFVPRKDERQLTADEIISKVNEYLKTN